jgi:hypothetical protein
MSALRSILDSLNDVEATISQITRDAGPEMSFGVQLSLQSLEARREMLKEELVEISHNEFVDICDYKIVPGAADSYAMSAVTGAWHDFQDMLSLIFGAVQTGVARTSTKLTADLVEKTRLNFGYAYQGSLGIVMTIRNDRLMLSESNLDQAVTAVFGAIRAKTPDEIRNVAHTFGVPVVRKLHHFSKLHSQFEMAAEIKWVKSKEISHSVLAQPAEFAEIVRIIEEKGDVTRDPVTVIGALLAWNTITKAFVLDVPDSEQISGHWAEDFDGRSERKVPANYRAELTKLTVVRYAEETDKVTWLLHSLIELGSWGN